MPTLNPRVNVTLSPSLDDLVRRLAVHQRSSKAQVLRELLEAAEPALQRAVALMDAASRAGPEVLSGLAASLARAQDVIEDTLAGTMARLEDRTSLVEVGGKVQRRRPARARNEPSPAVSGPHNPPSSNRGVRSPDKGPGKAGKAPSRGI